MSRLLIDNEYPCPACGHSATLAEPCECDCVYECPWCAGTGTARSCVKCDWTIGSGPRPDGRINIEERDDETSAPSTQEPALAAGRSAQRSAIASDASGHPGGVEANPQRGGLERMETPAGTGRGQSQMEQEVNSMRNAECGVRNEKPAQRTIYALQSSRVTLFEPSKFWTGQDYSADIRAALRFTTLADAESWLRAHKHVRGLLMVVEVTLPSLAETRSAK